MNFKKFKNEIDLNGYALIEDFFNSEKLDHLKLSLLDILNYINYSDEKDLRKRYY